MYKGFNIANYKQLKELISDVQMHNFDFDDTM